MIVEVGKEYDFNYTWPDGYTSKRGTVVYTDGPLVRIKDEHGHEEILNLCNVLFDSAREYDISKIRDLDGTIFMPGAIPTS
ncbi:hypothetical protein F4U94_14645 [Sphingobium limneticum]|uniref:hypothetical protein n=1 Tax=Sphingobium limneticum TaxID=1007511 RepID=UPI00123CE6E0|nr:hypothetical protein [Sphingobium limneticum]KAA9014070.1 hypothetical protein F4U94_14645 [Sphingobium limneticum]